MSFFYLIPFPRDNHFDQFLIQLFRVVHCISQGSQEKRNREDVCVCVCVCVCKIYENW